MPMLSACVSFQKFGRIATIRQQIAHDTIAIERSSLNRNQSFHVFINNEKAQALGVPDGVEFIKLLDERVTQKERSSGYKLCSNGYMLGREPQIMERDADWGNVWILWYICNK